MDQLIKNARLRCDYPNSLYKGNQKLPEPVVSAKVPFSKGPIRVSPPVLRYMSSSAPKPKPDPSGSAPIVYFLRNEKVPSGLENVDAGKIVDYSKMKLKQVYKVTKGDPDIVIERFKPSLNLISDFNRIKLMLTDQRMRQVAELLVLHLVIPRMIHGYDPQWFIQRLQRHMKDIEKRIWDHYHYEFVNAVTTDVQGDHSDMLMQYKAFLESVGHQQNDLLSLQQVMPYLEFVFNTLPLEAYADVEAGIKWVVSWNFEAPTYIESWINPRYLHANTTNFTNIYPNPLENLKNSSNANDPIYKVRSRPIFPSGVGLSKSRKWVLPAVFQWFELAIDGHTLKCNGILYIILDFIRDQYRSVESIRVHCKFPPGLLEKSLQKLELHGVVALDRQERFYIAKVDHDITFL